MNSMYLMNRTYIVENQALTTTDSLIRTSVAVADIQSRLPVYTYTLCWEHNTVQWNELIKFVLYAIKEHRFMEIGWNEVQSIIVCAWTDYLLKRSTSSTQRRTPNELTISLALRYT